MTATQDDLDIMRSLIPDDAPVFDDGYLFTDAQLGHYYTVAGGNLLRASALAVFALSTSEALISKVIKTQDLSTDGAKVATAMIAKGEALIKQAEAIEAADNGSYFEIVDYGYAGHPPELTEQEWRW